MIRFLHLADVHLDTAFAGRTPRVRARLREASREAFARAVDLALAERLDAVLVAGDLFDSARLSFETERFLGDQLGRLGDAGIPVVYASGNHDPGPGAGDGRSIRWPAHVTVIGDATPRRIPVRDASGSVIAWVTAAGHASVREGRDLAASFPEPDSSLPEIALLHAQVVGSRLSEEHDAYAPTTLPTLLASGYHYWALGHVHHRQCLHEVPAVHYPGNTQGRSHGERGAKGALVVELADGVARTEFRPLAPVRWETIPVGDLGEADTLDRLVARVRRAWETVRARDPDPAVEWMVRVDLEGGCPLHEVLSDTQELEALGRELADLLGVLDVVVRADGVHAAIDVVAHLGREDVLGVALRIVRALRSGDLTLEDIELEWADAADSAPDRLASILDGAEEELVALLLDPDAGA
jgi:DNA repair exonuclease SbcCD nuclease subunit